MMHKSQLTGIFIDALRPDFISERYTPFLYALTKENYFNELETILGYSDAIDATIFTGVYPNVHNYWMKYHLDKTNSVFKDVKLMRQLGFIDHIPSDFIRSGINYSLYNTVFKRMSKQVGYDGFASYNIPYRLIDNFNLTMKKSFYDEGAFGSLPTIFDLLKASQKTYHYSHGIRKNTLAICNKVDMGIIYLSDIDFYAHIFGLRSPVFFNALRKVDRKVKLIVETMRKNDPHASIIVFSDHGMADVHRVLDYRILLKHPDLYRRFLFALDGTMIRFWYFDDGMKDRIHELFLGDSHGHFLSESEKAGLKIDFAHNRYGDDIFLLDQGSAIYPNFMSWNTPKAMHAYHPRYPEQKGSIILSGGAFDDVPRARSSARLVDIMPIILKTLSLEA
jgi:predicted AlkP superfamily pyrophosphatase or phosphodiesterase